MNDTSTVESPVQSTSARPQALPSRGLDLADAVRTVSPLPRSAVFLGLAADGLPVLLDLRDTVPGPVLIVADPGAGRTRLLQVAARAADQAQDPEDVRYAVLTDRPQEWDGFDQSSNCEGVLTFQHPLTRSYVVSLMEWAHGEGRRGYFIVLLVDGLRALADDVDTRDALRWLLLRGPARRIWPIVTVSSTDAGALAPWVEMFRTRIFGKIRDAQQAEVLAGASDSALRDLTAGRQFTIRAGKSWLPFWLPELA